MKDMEIDPSWLINTLTEENHFIEITTLPAEWLIVPCADGKVRIHKRMLAFTWPHLIWVKQYPCPLSVCMFPGPDDLPIESTHQYLMTSICTYVHDYHKGKYSYQELSQLGTAPVRMLLAGMVNNLESYPGSLDITDYHELLTDPTMVGIRGRLEETVESGATPGDVGRAISQAYREMHEFINDVAIDRYRDSGLIQLIASGTCKAVQLNQGLMAVGYGSDVNSNFFPTPILENYSTGLKSVFSFVANTRSGAKSLMYAHEPMKTTEYLHRLTQLVSAVFNKIYYGDCGSTITYPVMVTKDREKGLIGKYFIDCGELKEMTKAVIPEYRGRIINVRNPTGCLVPDHAGCCSVCGGAVTNSLGSTAKVGWTMTTSTFSQASQKVLSVKHSDMTSVGLPSRVNPNLAHWLAPSDKVNGLVFDSNPQYQIGIHIPNNHKGRELLGTKLHELHHLRAADIHNIDPWDYSSFYAAEISRVDGLELPIEERILENYEEVALSKELLEYIWRNPDVMTLTTKKRKRRYYNIDLSGYNQDLPVFITRFSHKDTLKLFNAIKTFIRSSENDQALALDSFTTFGSAVLYFYDMVCNDINVNLATVELALYAFTANDPVNGDYRPARGSNSCQFANIDTLLNNRSLSAKLGSEEIDQVLATTAFAARSYRMPSALDSLFYTQ